MARYHKKYKQKQERFLGYGIAATITQLRNLKAILKQSNRECEKNNKPHVQLVCFIVEDEESVTYFVFGIPLSSPLMGGLLGEILQEVHGPLGELIIEDISKGSPPKNT